MKATNKQEGAIIQCSPRQQNHSGYTVRVTDSCGNLVRYGRTCKAGIFRFRAPVLDEYHIRVEGSNGFSPKAAHRWIRLDPCCCYTLCFIFNKQPVVTTATFTLTDRHYEGLPVQKGELHLCPIPILFP